MARIIEPTAEQEAGYADWVSTRPPKVRTVAARFEPWSLYRLKTTGQRVTIACFDEPEDDTAPVTLKVNVLAQFNVVMFERRVFGIDPDDLEPCDLPAATEPLGAHLTQDEVDDNIDVLRAMVLEDRQRS